MAIRVNTLLRELNIDLQTLDNWLKALGYHDAENLSINTKIPDSIVGSLKVIGESDLNFLSIIEKTARKETLENGHNIKGTQRTNNHLFEAFADTPIKYSNKPCFWMDDLMVLSSATKACRVNLGEFSQDEHIPLYSVLIGINGIGKSTLMKDIVDFFIDLRSYLNKSDTKPSLSKMGRLIGV